MLYCIPTIINTSKQVDLPKLKRRKKKSQVLTKIFFSLMGIERPDCSRPHTSKSTRPKIELNTWAWRYHPCLLDSVETPKMPPQIPPISSARKTCRTSSSVLLLPPHYSRLHSSVDANAAVDNRRHVFIISGGRGHSRAYQKWKHWPSVTTTMALAELARRTRSI
jgi:hypothetical protein